MVERAATQASDFGPEIPDSVFWSATKVRRSSPPAVAILLRLAWKWFLCLQCVHGGVALPGQSVCSHIAMSKTYVTSMLLRWELAQSSWASAAFSTSSML